MPYKFALHDLDYSDLASGRVLYSLPGYPAFPIRLASEIFQRCVARRARTGPLQRPILYDPCCGSAYHLSTLAFTHWHEIEAIIGSDINAQAVQVATRNLALLTPTGLQQRIQELTEHYHNFGKESHQVALESANTLYEVVTTMAKQQPIRTHVFQASAVDRDAMRAGLGDTRVDIVLTDVPYGQQSVWHVDQLAQAQQPIGAMLQALLGILHDRSIVAVVADKQQKIAHTAYTRLERFQIGKRQVALLQP